MTIDRAITTQSYSNRIAVLIPPQQFIVRRVYAIAQNRVLLACPTEITARPREMIFRLCIRFFCHVRHMIPGPPGARSKTSTAALDSFRPRDPSPSGPETVPRRDACKHSRGADKTCGASPKGASTTTARRSGEALQRSFGARAASPLSGTLMQGALAQALKRAPSYPAQAIREHRAAPI